MLPVHSLLRGLAANPGLPVALIENGTRPDQIVSAGSLHALPTLAARHGDGPVLLIIGKVAAYARDTIAQRQQRRA